MKQSNYISLNPYTEVVMGLYPEMEIPAALNCLENMKQSQKIWAKQPLAERILFLPKLSELLKQHADELAKIAAEEMGKLFVHAKAEVLKSATLCDYYFQVSDKELGSEIVSLENNIQIEKQYQPLGIVLGIFPWNFPYWQILRSLIPTVISGNAMLVKPAPNVPQSSLALQQLLEKCGLPEHLVQTVFVGNDSIQTLIQHPYISAVTLTGSEGAGASVAAAAGKAIKPVVLELGGSDPLLILKDAPLDEIIDHVVFSRFQNNGQSCVAAKRFLIEEEIYETFKVKLIEKVKAFVLGNPTDLQVHIGPLARKDLRDHLAQQVQSSIEAGAKLIYQHEQVPGQGYFYPPTLLENIPNHCAAATDELFGPVLSLYSFKGNAEAIQIANQTRFGLGASIFTKDITRASELAREIESGMVYINQIVKSDVRIPFGGIKNSGFGRELGPEGLRSFCQTKLVWSPKIG